MGRLLSPLLASASLLCLSWLHRHKLCLDYSGNSCVSLDYSDTSSVSVCVFLLHKKLHSSRWKVKFCLCQGVTSLKIERMTGRRYWMFLILASRIRWSLRLPISFVYSDNYKCQQVGVVSTNAYYNQCDTKWLFLDTLASLTTMN